MIRNWQGLGVVVLVTGMLCLCQFSYASGMKKQSNAYVNGMTLEGDGDGAITFTGTGDGFDEDLTMNLDDTSNTGVFTSSTSLALLSFPAMDLAVEDEAYEATNWNGSLQVPTKNAVRDKIEALTASDTFQRTSTVLNSITATDSLTLGSSTNAGKLYIDGDTDEPQALIEANGTQNAPILYIRKSDGTALFTVSNDGVTTFGSSGSTGTITLYENSSIALDPAGSADGKYSGTTVTGSAGSVLAFGDLIALDFTDSQWRLADANVASGADGDSRGMVGICVLAAASQGSATTILLNDIVRADAVFPALTIAAPVYVGEVSGDIVVTQPTTTDVVIKILGSAMTADEIYFDPDKTWTTHT